MALDLADAVPGLAFAPLQRLFGARGVAVLGASSDPGKIGGRPLRYLAGAGYAGAVHAVNPKYAEIMGRPCWPSAAAIPDPVDLALVAVPAAAVPDAIDDCATAGIPFACVFSAGFAETGPGGRAAQERLVARARERGVRLVGPNTLGVASAPNSLVASFATLFDRHPRLLPGRVGFVSQSGALGVFIYALAQDQGHGFSRFVSIGNEGDLDVADFLAYFAEDDETVAVGGYLESVKDGARFLAAAERVAAAGKPMAFLKVGRSEAGRRAAESHTGALAGSDAVYDAALRQAGIVRAADPQGLVDFLGHHGRRPRPPRPGGVAVLTISGGAGVWTADRLADLDVELATLAPVTRERLTATLPDFAAPQNPLDATGQILNRPDLFASCLDALLDDPGVAALLVVLGLQERDGDALARRLAQAAAERPDALVAVAWLAGPAAAYDILRDAGVPVSGDLARATDLVAGALTAARRAGVRRGRPAPAPALPDGVLAAAGTEHGAKRLLEAIGIPVPAGRLCRDRDAAIAAAAELGAPVAMKGQVRGLSHKTEHGLVRLGVEDAGAAFDALDAAMRGAGPPTAIDGVLVEAMAPPGVEVVVGVVQDEAFGPTVMVGLGGVHVEVMGDVAFRVAPVDAAEARSMIDETRGAALLRGFRGSEPCDVDALAGAIAAISRLAAAHRDAVRELEVNPLRVLPRGRGVVALDALVVPAQEAA